MLRKETIKSIVKKYIKNLPIKVEQAILFGSSARGDRLYNSDIDLIIVSKDFKGMSFPERFLVLYKNWKEKVDLEIFPLTLEEFKELRSKSIILQEAVKYGEKLIPVERTKDEKIIGQ